MIDIWCFWDKLIRLWIVTIHDADGNQLWDAQYYPNRKQLASDWMAK